MNHNKLVRDKIPEIIKGNGQTPFVHIADQAEYEIKLRAKLQEEVAEFLESQSEEELADILEVMKALCEFYDFDFQSLEKIRQKKFTERGGFSQRIILDKTE